MGHHDKRPLPGTGNGLQNQFVHLTGEQTDNTAHCTSSQEYPPFVRDHILKARALFRMAGAAEYADDRSFMTVQAQTHLAAARAMLAGGPA
ncbi:hypothetical protein ABENE_22995 [Asticcacaulis benevestitus DSM 16100 = ATCC BAA-896]|uniref:Uncharacterized protein n=1 Tax=Asticcacaulis benevestitus DSM 16100 = ATCC BAA-896 TaxID=1121022 RepID=V4NV65_9CAUL|nr:hypothetical protein ABENE_22995 [Asticcacaulis benevestitus DSM 16100 = ATCC BAA-896]